MISSSMGIAVSGLMAASKRLDNSANNVANISSASNASTGREAFKPQQVTQTSLATGGVRSGLQASEPSSFAVYQPDSVQADAQGIVNYPNVSLEREVVDQQLAKYDYKANLKVIERTDDMMEDLLNITA